MSTPQVHAATRAQTQADLDAVDVQIASLEAELASGRAALDRQRVHHLRQLETDLAGLPPENHELYRRGALRQKYAIHPALVPIHLQLRMLMHKRHVLATRLRGYAQP